MILTQVFSNCQYFLLLSKMFSHWRLSGSSVHSPKLQFNGFLIWMAALKCFSYHRWFTWSFETTDRDKQGTTGLATSKTLSRDILVLTGCTFLLFAKCFFLIITNGGWFLLFPSCLMWPQFCISRVAEITFPAYTVFNKQHQCSEWVFFFKD